MITFLVSLIFIHEHDDLKVNIVKSILQRINQYVVYMCLYD